MDSAGHLLSEVLEERNLLDAKISELELALADLERKQLEAKLALAELRRKRNSFSPVIQLSSDILLYIFEYLQDDSDNFESYYDFSPPKEPSPPSTLPPSRTITHVCSSWRTVALSAATLWTKLTFRTNSEVFIPELLQRSRNAPLAISFFQRAESNRKEKSLFLRVMRSEIQRIRSLTLDINVGALSDCISTHLSRLPLDETSAMEVLSLWRPYTLTESIWLKLLKFSSNTLRFLDLRNFSFGSIELPDKIHCPRLSRVRLRGESQDFVDLLNKLSCPRTCSFALGCWASVDGHPELIRFLPKLCPGRLLTRLSFSQISSSDVHNISISFGSGGDHDPDIFMNLEAHGSVSDSGVLPTPVLKNLLSCFDLSRLTSLCFSNGDYERGLSPTTWAFLSEKCCNVQSLVVLDHPCVPLCQVLYVQYQSHSNDGH
ncbi:hypothetical protein BDN72DRAFT_902082 [Pluteus cervinus]|uniref:Uncharacterized protein n=1 Tax=Pluteus cervinus TaxID=181527 RepID=A0ACD3AEJ2_9AGAR|nr:hypothetical protein BDN72DRAFT_902082 [Pluteus cervinus]